MAAIMSVSSVFQPATGYGMSIIVLKDPQIGKLLQSALCGNCGQRLNSRKQPLHVLLYNYNE